MHDRTEPAAKESKQATQCKYMNTRRLTLARLLGMLGQEFWDYERLVHVRYTLAKHFRVGTILRDIKDQQMQKHAMQVEAKSYPRCLC